MLLAGETSKKPLPIEEAREYPLDRLCEEEGVELRRAGRCLKGICPFHNDHTPSLVVYPESNRWHCFGCGEGGDVVTFVMKFNGINFQEAIARLGGKV